MAGVTFVNAISNTVIWDVEDRMPIWAALREVANRSGVRVGQVKLFNERGPVNDLEDIGGPVISVVLLSQ